jgi:uncharacterized protein
MKIKTLSLIALLAFGACSTAPVAPAETMKSTQTSLPADYLAWQSQRKASLTAEKGWLSLIGLHWLERGTYTIGSANDQQIRLQAGPPALGLIVFDGESDIRLIPIATGILFDGQQPADIIGALKTDKGGATPTEVSIGSMSFFVIDRSGRIGLRVKDANAPSRLEFKGLDYFTYAPELKITARYEAYATPRLLDVGTIIGTIEPTPNPGRAHFQLYGKDYQFELLEGSDATHFFSIFGDQTNGKETYGMARFLTGEMNIANSTVTLDFNRLQPALCIYRICHLPDATGRQSHCCESASR